MGDITYPFGLNDADGKTTQSSHIFRTIASSYTAAIFVIVPIDNVMATVFDAPVAAVGGKNALGVGLFRSSAGNTISDFA